MAKFYTAGKQFLEFISENGFTFHEAGRTEKKYYTNHETGNQVRIDFETRLIALLDSKGNVVDEHSSFTDQELSSFFENNY